MYVYGYLSWDLNFHYFIIFSTASVFRPPLSSLLRGLSWREEVVFGEQLSAVGGELFLNSNSIANTHRVRP